MRPADCSQSTAVMRGNRLLHGLPNSVRDSASGVPHPQPHWIYGLASVVMPHALRPHGSTLGDSAEHSAEERVAPGGLSECARIGEQWRHAGLAPGGMESIDEVRKRIETDVLGECHSQCEST